MELWSCGPSLLRDCLLRRRWRRARSSDRSVLTATDRSHITIGVGTIVNFGCVMRRRRADPDRRQLPDRGTGVQHSSPQRHPSRCPSRDGSARASPARRLCRTRSSTTCGSSSAVVVCRGRHGSVDDRLVVRTPAAVVTTRPVPAGASRSGRTRPGSCATSAIADRRRLPPPRSHWRPRAIASRIAVMVEFTLDGRPVSRARGRAARPRGRAPRHVHPDALPRLEARPVRRLPHVRRRRRGRAAAAACLCDPRQPRAWSSRRTGRSRTSSAR